MGRISGISGISGLSGISGPHYFPGIIVKGRVSSIPPGGDLFFKSVGLHHPAGFWQNGGYPPDGAGCVTTLFISYINDAFHTICPVERDSGLVITKRRKNPRDW